MKKIQHRKKAHSKTHRGQDKVMHKWMKKYTQKQTCAFLKTKPPYWAEEVPRRTKVAEEAEAAEFPSRSPTGPRRQKRRRGGNKRSLEASKKKRRSENKRSQLRQNGTKTTAAGLRRNGEKWRGRGRGRKIEKILVFH